MTIGARLNWRNLATWLHTYASRACARARTYDRHHRRYQRRTKWQVMFSYTLCVECRTITGCPRNSSFLLNYKSILNKLRDYWRKNWFRKASVFIRRLLFWSFVCVCIICLMFKIFPPSHTGTVPNLSNIHTYVHTYMLMWKHTCVLCLMLKVYRDRLEFNCLKQIHRMNDWPITISKE